MNKDEIKDWEEAPATVVDYEPLIPTDNQKVYCSCGHTGESNWILPLGLELTSNIKEASVVVFGGGKDIDPGFYNEKRGHRTDLPNGRDKEEQRDFEIIQSLRKKGKKIKIVGVCRG